MIDRRQGLHRLLADDDHAADRPSTEKVIDPDNKRATDPNVLIAANYPVLARDALAGKLGIDLDDKPQLAQAARASCPTACARQLRDMVIADPVVIGTTRDVDVLAAANIDSAFKGQIDLDVAEAKRKVSDQQVDWMNKLAADGTLAEHFNTGPLHLRRIEPPGNRRAWASPSSARST